MLFEKKIPSSFEKDIYFNVNRLKNIGEIN